VRSCSLPHLVSTTCSRCPIGANADGQRQHRAVGPPAPMAARGCGEREIAATESAAARADDRRVSATMAEWVGLSGRSTGTPVPRMSASAGSPPCGARRSTWQRASLPDLIGCARRRVSRTGYDCAEVHVRSVSTPSSRRCRWLISRGPAGGLRRVGIDRRGAENRTAVTRFDCIEYTAEHAIDEAGQRDPHGAARPMLADARTDECCSESAACCACTRPPRRSGGGEARWRDQTDLAEELRQLDSVRCQHHRRRCPRTAKRPRSTRAR